MNITSSLVAELREKAYRDAYVASQIRVGLPFQIRALRQQKGWTQGDLAAHAGMSQPRIAEIEKPGERKFNLETLLRIAAAFDVGLTVNFVPITELINREDRFDPDTFSVPTFAEELAAAERRAATRAELKKFEQRVNRLIGRQNRQSLDARRYRLVESPSGQASLGFSATRDLRLVRGAEREITDRLQKHLEETSAGGVGRVANPPPASTDYQQPVAAVGGR